MSFLSVRARIELAVTSLVTSLSIAVFSEAADAKATTNIPTKCDWAHSFQGFFYTVAGEVKGLAYVLGPATVVVLLVVLMFLFRSNSRGSLFAWVVFIIFMLFLLGIIGTVTGAITTGGC